MKKVHLTDNSGRWFDEDTAKVFDADYVYVGNPYRPICLATNSEFSHERLYFTDQSTFILHYWDDSDVSEYREISPEGAARWLISNGHQDKLAHLELLPEEAAL